jgi:uncharacterized protein (TIGR02145 family)
MAYCITGFTSGGYYNFINCCGLKEEGFASTIINVCIDSNYSATTQGIIYDVSSTCTSNCNQGPLNYNFTVTGTCYAGSGTTIINVFNGQPIYTINNEIPGTLGSQTGLGPFTFSGLSAGTYTFRINDSSGGVNEDLYVNVIISDCFRVIAYGASGTTCGLDNGSFYVSGVTNSSPYGFALYQGVNMIDFQTSANQPYQFTNLSAGTYYVTMVDYGNVSANTGTILISPSVGVDFGFWKVDTSNCVIDEGKLAVTGITGTAPYTYLWSNGETTSLITGLTQGSYTCTVTDSLGCQTTKSELIGVVDPLGVGLVTSVEPSCFASDGSLTYTITGGSRPLYFSANTGQVGYTFDDTIVITNLSSGSYVTTVRDANFCEIVLNGFVTPQNGFTVVDTIITNSICNQQSGSVNVQLAGQNGFYTYVLSGQSSGTILTSTSQNQTHTFNNLPNDNYILAISGSGTNCFYSSTLIINSEQKFTISATTTNATCGQYNGQIFVNVSTGYTGTLDYFLSDGQSNPNSPFSANTFYNLNAGTYTVNVVDDAGCSVSETVSISTTPGIVFSVTETNCTNGSNGEAEVTIYQGLPIFTYQWSDNVPNNQTGSTVTGLTAGTYSVEVTDSNGCSSEQKFEIVCNGLLYTGYEIFTICKDQFITTTGTQRGFDEMLNEGYMDITSGYTGCSFNSAEFIAQININGSAYTQSFYTATTLNDVPQDSLWQTTIEGILSGITEIGEYSIDILNNTLQIKSNCSGDYDPLADAPFSLGLQIVYDVVCTEGVTPTPTPTPTATPINCSMSGYTFEINQIIPTPTPSPTPTPICFGYLYNWYAATDVRNIGAIGWEVPTISDYQVLADYLGAAGNYLSNTVGGKLKVTGLTYWISPNLGATNEVGFNGVGSAGRTLGGFSTLGANGNLWTRDNPFAISGYLGQLYSNDQRFACVNNTSYPKYHGYSLRLKKITTTLSNGQTGTYVGNDGKTYTTICIGTQEWLSQNLTETKYRDLTDIPNVSDQSTWDGLTTGAYCVHDTLDVNGCSFPTP